MDNYKLKRLFKKILFFLIVTIVLWLFKLSMVNAVSIKPYDFVIFGVQSLPTQNWIRTNGSQRFNQTIFTLNTTNITTSLPADVQLFTELYACVTQDGDGDLPNVSYITNTNQEGGFRNGNVNSVNLNIACKVPDGYNGTLYKFYFQIYSWEIPAGGADYFRVSSYWNFDRFTMNTLNITITDIYITDTDNYTNDKILASQGKGQQVIINQNGQIIDNTNSTNQKLDDLNKNITDDTPPDFNGLKNSAGWLPKGPVDSIINLPLSLLENIQDNLGKTCQPVSLPLPFVNKNIDLPCINSLYSQIEGMNTFFNWCGVVASVFILFRYLIYLYNRVDSTLTLRENTLPGYFEDSMWGGM